jgi:3-methyladenine DNA glycosylase AlkD
MIADRQRSMYFSVNEFYFDANTLFMNIAMNPRTNLILTTLYSKANPKNVEGMARYGIKSTGKVLGISMPFLQSIKKSMGVNHHLALELWHTGVYEARLLAAFIADPKQITISLMNQWVRDFDNWAICDGVCMHCFRNSPYAHKIIGKWTKQKSEFVRRAGFTLIATLSVVDKKSEDTVFLKYLPLIKKYSTDERNYVKKAVNWALRQIGKRNAKLNAAAIRTAQEVRKMDSSAARWIAADALRELQSPQVQTRLKKKSG